MFDRDDRVEKVGVAATLPDDGEMAPAQETGTDTGYVLADNPFEGRAACRRHATSKDAARRNGTSTFSGTSELKQLRTATAGLKVVQR